MATAKELGPGGLREDGRPIFIATDHTKFTPSTKQELTDQQKLAWKSFQLWRTTLGIERRDNVYKTLTNSDYTNFRLGTHILGTPYPVIETVPGFFDVFKAVRWYEHAISLAVALGYGYWIRSKASTRYSRMMPMSRTSITMLTFISTDLCFCYRSMYRLTGYLPNEYECFKYGVLEDKDKLQRKKELWEKYANHKREWCRRYDYHVYGIRPGETFSFFSACMIPSWEPRYNTRTDYPPRKNPYFLTSTPLRDTFLESPFTYEIPKDETVPLVRERPELKYLYRGPGRTTPPSDEK
ncbi:NADH-ubiquinone oxidoreductase complex I, 21 kDa subunit, putative [Trypanosoma equiperdum]|uniref:NADH-ubiquinone oxidoreductase 21kDa subunit N-terminal domain-containing protein n=3 Tax=Trypanozoon TaxID=39700 RepID=Q384S6_TRYB2|nr:hypothetical protein, conserved [Trypanosoma brucei gambiense DAL972]XP_828817.1 hypothetical protein, conserved [Trypanosoma brucei brucei TREU927]EAN79705.1 hypothetical protein, conserved [Trypanosoma brucei brucei TREU927]CBH17726.1 hypothetical protein, conserved [Trypanosoma brucei gambiense DAL972]SCU70847.1 NADH-ubiquinone oxidoreductase complex I, 21 kDa subunit, putative [Trypanosoma equiperdum]|eukprot:XP_011779990.1 hypothetical protein, conserved [Trypanosoma brucei gambiense DAL972]